MNLKIKCYGYDSIVHHIKSHNYIGCSSMSTLVLSHYDYEYVFAHTKSKGSTYKQVHVFNDRFPSSR